MKKWKLIIPTLLAFANAPLFVTVGCTKSKDPVAKDFATDPWSTVCFYANQGLEKLHEAYAFDCRKNYFMPGTLIGLQRTVIINGAPHNVMVVDENADSYDKDGVDTPAALTFHFRNLISGGDLSYKGKIMALFINWSDNRDEGSGKYWDSALNNALNGTDTKSRPVKWQNENESFADIHISVFQMINNENLDLANNIKLVKRTVCTYDEKTQDEEQAPIWNLSPGSAKLFVPTISNYFSRQGISDTGAELIDPKHYELCLNEGQTNTTRTSRQYQYYANKNRIGDSKIGKNIGQEGEEKPTFDFLIIKDVAGSAPEPGSDTYWSWTGSPWLESKLGTDPSPGSSGDRVANISPWGGFCNHADINDFNALAPCFCI